MEDTEHINFINKNPNNKSKPSFKKYCQYCHRTNHSISSCYIKKEMMNIIKTDIQNQNHHNKPLFNILKENQIKTIIKKHSIITIMKEIAIEAIPMEDQDKILEIIQEITEVIQDQIQDPDILNIQIDLIVHTNLDQDMIIIKIRTDIIDKIIIPNLHIEIIIPIITLSLRIETTPDKDSDQDHKHQTQTLTDIIIHIDHLQNQDLIITDQDHHHLQDKILKE